MIRFNLPKLTKGATTREIVCGNDIVRMPGNQRDFIAADGEGYVLRDIDASGNVIGEHKLIGTAIVDLSVPVPVSTLPKPAASPFATLGTLSVPKTTDPFAKVMDK